MTSTTTTASDHLKQALTNAFLQAMEYGNDDTVAASDIEAFVKLHLEDFREMVADYVAERI